MTTLTVEFDKNTIEYISSKHKDINSYLSRLINEDILLNEINESKISGINTLNSLNELDD